MLIKTEAICIKNTRYGESSVISKMFTYENGISSFIIQGINRKSSQIKPSHITPGNLVEVVVYQKANANIQRIKELKVTAPLHQVHTNMIKNAILQFYLELISKTSEDDFKDEHIFFFLKSFILKLESETENQNFMPLLFLCEYLKLSGWYPNLDSWENDSIFNLTEGKFEPESAHHSMNKLDSKISNQLFKLLNSSHIDAYISPLEISERKTLFWCLINYLELHVLKGKKIKSPGILSEIIA